MRAIVTGSRQWLEQAPLYRALDVEYLLFIKAGRHETGEVFTVVHGNAPGADALANQWCYDRRAERFIVVEPHPADWRHGDYAGHQRNHEMVMLGADVVLAFFQAGAANRGTRNCVDSAKSNLEWKGTIIKEFWSNDV